MVHIQLALETRSTPPLAPRVAQGRWPPANPVAPRVLRTGKGRRCLRLHARRANQRATRGSYRLTIARHASTYWLRGQDAVHRTFGPPDFFFGRPIQPKNSKLSFDQFLVLSPFLASVWRQCIRHTKNRCQHVTDHAVK